MKLYELFELYADEKNRDRKFEDIIGSVIIYYENGFIRYEEKTLLPDKGIARSDIVERYTSYSMMNRGIEEIIND